MNIEKIILRNKPRFELSIANNYFEIYNEDYKKDNGVYSFEYIDSMELKEGKIDWIFIIISIISEFGTGDAKKKKNELIFNYKNKPKQIFLTKCDITKSKEVIDRIKRMIN